MQAVLQQVVQSALLLMMPLSTAKRWQKKFVIQHLLLWELKIEVLKQKAKASIIKLVFFIKVQELPYFGKSVLSLTRMTWQNMTKTEVN